MRSSFVLLLVLAAFGTAAASASAAPAWLPPGTISPAEESSTEPRLALNADGDAVVAWTHYAGAPGYQTVVSTRPAGGAWSPPARFPCGISSCENQVAIDAAGRVAVVYRDYQGATGGPIEAALGSVGGEWGQSTPLMETDKYGAEPTVAFDASGGLTALWRQIEGLNYRVREATRPAGGPWGQARDISPAGEETAAPQLGLDAAGDAVAIWSGHEATYNVIQSSSRSVGGDWGPVLDISAGEVNSLQPHLAMSPTGRGVAVWLQQNKESGYYFTQALSLVPGVGWAKPPVELADGVTPSASPTVAIDERGDATAVWMEVEGGHYVIRAAGQPAGGAWEQPTRLTAPGELGAEPTVGLDSRGDATVLWTTQDGSRYLARSARRPAGAGWTSPETISGESFEASSASVATDADGDALTVWEGMHGVVPTIEVAAFDGAGPQLRSLAIPGTGAVGATLDFSVAPVDAFTPVGAIAWNFGDGATADTARATHSYSRPGTYAVSVEATDALGNVSRATGTVTIPAPATPVAPKNQGAPPKGSAHAGRVIRVKGGKALVAFTCGGAAACAGTVKLTVPAPKPKGRAPRKARPPLLLGKASFQIAAGKKKTVAVALKPRALARLGHHAAHLPARLEGSGLAPRAVVLAFPTKHRHKGAGRR